MEQRHNAKTHRIQLPLKKTNKTRFFFSLIIFISCFLFTSRVHFNDCPMPSTRDAYITGNKITVPAPLSGRVAHVHLPSNDWVNNGDILVSMDNTDALNRYRQAEKTLSDTIKKNQNRYVSIDQNNIRILKAQMAYQQALNEYHRRILSKGARVIAKHDLQQSLKAVDSTKHALDMAIRKYRENQQRLRAADAAQQRLISQARREMQKAQQVLLRTQVRSPVAGYVVQRHVDDNASVTAAQPLMTVMPAGEMWVMASFSVTHRCGLTVGQRASIVTDVYGVSVVFDGHIEEILLTPDKPLPRLSVPKSATDRDKMLKRIPVRISLNPLQLGHFPLRPGANLKVTLIPSRSSVVDR